MSVYRLPRRMVAVLLVAAAAVVGSQLGASVAVGASGQPAAATGNGPGNPQAVPPSLGPATQCAPTAGFPAATTPVAYWSTEARCAIVPPSAGPENFGNKFPGETVYMGIIHVAIYDAAVAIEARYRPFLPTPKAPAHTSPAAAIAAATHDTLSGLQPALGLTAGQQAILDSDYAAYLAAIPDGTAKANGLDIGRQVAAAVIASRANDGRDRNPTVADLNPPAPGRESGSLTQPGRCSACGSRASPRSRSRSRRSSGLTARSPSPVRRMPTT